MQSSLWSPFVADMTEAMERARLPALFPESGVPSSSGPQEQPQAGTGPSGSHPGPSGMAAPSSSEAGPSSSAALAVRPAPATVPMPDQAGALAELTAAAAGLHGAAAMPAAGF